jgi:hypothetical protein
VHRDLIRCSGCRGRVTAPGPDYFRTLDLASYAVSGDVVVPLLGRAERRKSIAGRLSRRPQSRLAAFWGGPSASPTRHSKAHRPSP